MLKKIQRIWNDPTEDEQAVIMSIMLALWWIGFISRRRSYDKQ